mgnify:FL=1
MKKDDIRTFVVIIIICTLITGLVLFLNSKSNSDKLEAVDEYNNFFTITNYVNNYLEYSSTYNASKLYDVLYSDYIDSKGITINNLFDYLKEYSIDISVEVNKIEYVSVKNNYIYYIQGKLNEMTFDTTNVIDNDFRIIVIVDFDNSTYAVYPLSDKDDYKKIIDSIKKINIDSNSNNRTIKSDLITKEKICVLYLSDYVNKLNYDIEEAYKLLDDTTKKNYSLEKFKSYINNNFDKITTDADKCLFETVGDKRIYTVIDKNGNRYVFRENGIMNYKVNFYLNDEESES